MSKMSISNKKGFTLVEAVVSILILGITVISMLSALVMGREVIEKMKHRTKAMNLLRSRMEWVKEQSFSTVESWEDTPIVENNVDDAIGTDELLNDTRTTSVTDEGNDVFIVTINLTWDGSLSEEIVSVIAQ